MTGAGSGDGLAPRPAGRRVVVAVVAAPGATEDARGWVRALAHRADVRALDRAPRPDALLAIGADAVVPTAPGGRDGAPVARLADGVVTVDVAVTDGDGGPGTVRVPVPGGATVDTAAHPPLPPHVRRRWRARLGLPADLVVDTGALAAADVPTALAVAAAAVVTAEHLPLALALGCPTVTTAEGAAAVGAADRVHLVVVDGPAADRSCDPGAAREAAALAADERRAAALARRGRALAVTALDPAASVSVVLSALGLVDDGPVARMAARLDELGTAPAAAVRRRAAEALAVLAPEGAV